MPSIDPKKKLSYQRKYRSTERGKANQLLSNRRHRTKRKEIFDAYKMQKGCLYCSIKNPIALQFHHRNPAEKSFSIANNIIAKSLDDLFTEIEKCDVVCANCHLIEHARLREV